MPTEVTAILCQHSIDKKCYRWNSQCKLSSYNSLSQSCTNHPPV